MVLRYDLPPASGALRQGEILGDVYEHISNLPASRSQERQESLVESVKHNLLIVMSPDCDLDFDFKARFPNKEGKEQPKSIQEFMELGKILLHIILAKISTDITPTLPSTILKVLFAKVCDKATIGTRFVKTEVWKLVTQNQNERYHYFPEAPIGDPPINTLPELYIDFKKSISIPTQSLYAGLHGGEIKRIGLVPDRYIHDLMHRFYGFLSRVGV